MFFVEWTYDGAGRITEYEYDARNRLAAVRLTNSEAATYEYTAHGLVKEVSYGGSGQTLKRAYGYDAANRVTSVVNTLSAGASEAYEYGYDANGNRTSETRRRNGAVTQTQTYGYDVLDRLTSVSVTAGGTTQAVTYGYDAVGNRTSEVSGASNRSATFDELNRLTQLRENNVVTGTFSYDANGNLLSQSIGGAVTNCSYVNKHAKLPR